MARSYQSVLQSIDRDDLIVGVSLARIAKAKGLTTAEVRQAHDEGRLQIFTRIALVPERSLVPIAGDAMEAGHGKRS